MFGRTLFLLSFLAGPVLADVQTVIEGHIEPGYTNLLATTTIPLVWGDFGGVRR